MVALKLVRSDAYTITRSEASESVRQSTVGRSAGHSIADESPHRLALALDDGTVKVTDFVHTATVVVQPGGQVVGV